MARDALLREAYRRRPAKVDDKGKGAGARDAAIWLTVLGCCSIASPSAVYFVAFDGGDFGKERLHAELAAEAPDNLHYCYGLEPLLEKLAEPSDRPKADVLDVLRTTNVRDAVRSLLNDVESLAEMSVPILARGSFPSGRAGALSGRTELTIAAVDETGAHVYKTDEDTTLIVGDVDWKVDVYWADMGDEGWSFKPMLISHGEFSFRTTIVVLERNNGALEAVSVANWGPLKLKALSPTSD